MQQRDGACYDEAVRAWEVSDLLAMLRAEVEISTQPLPIHLLDGPTADLQELASCRWLTPLRPLHPDCTPVAARSGLGHRPGKRPSARAFACPATERSLIEFRHHSLKASTIASWSLPVAVEVSKSFRQGPELHSRPVQTLDHLQPAGKPCKRRR